MKGYVEMSRFKIILPSSDKKNMSAVAAAKMEFTRRLLFTGFVLVLACLAGFAYISKAWFASNKEVGAENASVTSETGTPNLFIRLQSDKGKEPEYFSFIGTNWKDVGPALYPISTADCKNWYYINNWTMDLSEEVNGITTGQYYASGYAPVTFDENNDGCYTLKISDIKNKTYRAYYCSRYNLYSDKENSKVDVYLNPTEPIKVTFDEANRGLMEAIRVAVVASDELVFVYAPVDESGTGRNYIGGVDADGKPKKAAENTFYAVTGPNTATEQSDILVGDAGLEAYKGEKVPGDDHSFTAGAEKTKICTATPAGVDVSVYIWLEGMDAQSIITVADSRTIGVNLNFVGVPVDGGAA